MTLRILAAVLLVLVSLVPGPAVASAATDYTCTGGVIPPGTYASLTVAGMCSIPSGTVTVQGDVTIRPGAGLNAAIADLSVLPAVTGGNLVVMGNMFVGQNGILVLGCAPSLPCATLSDSRIYGSLRADRPLAMIVHGNQIGGHVDVRGGGGGMTCEPSAPLNELLGIPPQSPFQFPAFTTFEGNTISGGVSVSGLESCWFGLIRNDVSGTVKLMNDKLADPDAMEIVTNKIQGSLACSGNSPEPQVGDSEGEMNVVTGQMLGQCANIQ